MAQPEPGSEPSQPPLSPPTKSGFLRKLFGRTHDAQSNPHAEPPQQTSPEPVPFNRLSRKVVAGLPRAQTFKRQQSEQRVHLTPVETNPQERRAASVDRRSRDPRRRGVSQVFNNPRVSAPGFFNASHQVPPAISHGPPGPATTAEGVSGEETANADPTSGETDQSVDEQRTHDTLSSADARSITSSQYEAQIHDELESIWILNLSMHFRDRSKREKFFVTFRESEHLWRRVTVSLDYRNAPMNSLEMDLIHTEYQRDKSAKIYEAIRESLPEIQFYDTVTNLKLQTTDGRLHVHVVEDGNEIIHYPPVAQVQYLGCRRVKEKDIDFEAHMSGFVYKVNVNGVTLIKKEIPSPETIDEFLYEINALNSLRFSNHVVSFYGVVVDDHDEHIKGLLISYADQGALIDVIYDHCKDGGQGLPWSVREKWARQIVQGLADIHESGFVQGDFTLSNIVIDAAGDAKIIDINRRGCPVGWEPPEATPLIESNQRISMYIGVKSDLFQLGMVLWGLAMEEDEPELQGRPLILGPEVGVPDWYRQMTELCLSYDPRMRPQASSLMCMFPPEAISGNKKQMHLGETLVAADDGYSLHSADGYYAPDGGPFIRTVEPQDEWAYINRRYASPSPYPPYYHTRGRSPPSPLPSNLDRSESPSGRYGRTTWAANMNIAPSYSDVGADELPPLGIIQQPTPTPTVDKEPTDLGGPPPHQHEFDSQGIDDPSRIPGAVDWEIDTPKGEPNSSANPGKDLELGNSITEGTLKGDQSPDEGNENTKENSQIENTQNGDSVEDGYGTPETVELKGGKEFNTPESTAEARPMEEEEGFYTPGTTAPEAIALGSTGTSQTEDAENSGSDTPTAVTDKQQEPLTEPKDSHVPRTVKLPDSLAGVGALHVTTDDDLMREKGVIDDDFRVEARPEAV